MTDLYFLREEQRKAACQSCNWTGLTGATEMLIPDYEDRVAPGDPTPVGICPECSCLCHYVDAPRTLEHKSDRELLADCNELARKFCASRGFQVPAGYVFHKATHPDALEMWMLAVIAYAELLAISMGDVANNVEDL